MNIRPFLKIIYQADKNKHDKQPQSPYFTGKGDWSYYSHNLPITPTNLTWKKTRNGLTNTLSNTTNKHHKTYNKRETH